MELSERWEDTLPGAIYRVEIFPNGKYRPVFLYAQIEEISGYSNKEIVAGKPNWHDLVVEEDRDLFLKSVNPNPDQTFLLWEYRILHRNGIVKTVMNRTKTIWVDGEPKWRTGVILDISEQRQKEHELKKQSQFLEWVAQTAKIGGWEIDIGKMTIRWSHEIYNIREVEKNIEMTVQAALSFYRPEVRPVIEKALKNGIENGEPWDLELPIITAKGNPRWVRDVGIPEMKHGKCVVLRGVIEDITDRKASELTLQRKEQSLELALSGADLGTWDWNVTNGEVIFNERFAAILGYALNELNPHLSSWVKLVHPDDIRYVMEVLHAHLQGKTKFYETEHRVRHKSGHWVWVLDKGKIVERDINGLAMRASGTFLDISERKNTELKNLRLQQELEEFKTAVNSSSIVSIADLKGKIKFTNKKFEEISQYNWSEVVGKSHNIINSGFHSRSFWIEMWRTIASGNSWRAEVKNKRKDGTFYWVDTFIMPLRDAENRIKEYLSIRNDITEKKDNEEKLKNALEKAEAADRLKSTFLANMSHEIRTPMNAIMGLAELLERPNFSEERRLEFALLIRERGHYLLNIVNDILDISRIESGQVSSLKVAGNIHELFERLMLTFQADTARLQKNVDMRVMNKLDPNEGLIVADFIRLNQVLTNLLTNACKFTKDGHIEMGCQLLNNETLIFHVHDTGIGILQEQLETIFIPFCQADDSIHQQYGGSGLGLAISKGLVELWGGKIWVESKIGEFSTFYFTMPYIKQA